MVQVDLPGAFAAGQIFAVLTKKYLKEEEKLFTHPLMGPVVSYFALMFVPAGLFLLLCWPSWECMYWWQWVEKPAMNPAVSLFYLGFYMSMIVIGIASYVLAHSLYRKGKDRTVMVAAIGSVIATLLPFFLWPFTWYHIGTYADYNAVPRTTSTMFNTQRFFFSWLAVMSYFFLGSTAFGFWLKRSSQKIKIS